MTFLLKQLGIYSLILINTFVIFSCSSQSIKAEKQVNVTAENTATENITSITRADLLATLLNMSQPTTKQTMSLIKRLTYESTAELSQVNEALHGELLLALTHFISQYAKNQTIQPAIKSIVLAMPRIYDQAFIALLSKDIQFSLNEIILAYFSVPTEQNKSNYIQAIGDMAQHFNDSQRYQAQTFVIAATFDEKPYNRKKAALALGEFKSDLSIARLEKISKSDPYFINTAPSKRFLVRDAAKKILEQYKTAN